MPATANIDPAVVGHRLAEFRKGRGVTQQDAAAHLDCSRPILIAIEKGTRAPKPEEIVKLAAFYGRSVHEVVRPGAPNVALRPHLRAALDASHEGDGELDAAIAEFQALAEDYCELERLAGAKPADTYLPAIEVHPRVNVTEFAEDVAARERSRLHLGDQPLLNLRQVLENEVGLRIFLSSLPSWLAGMYAYVADLGYCVQVNRKHPPDRQRFTMAHEYGHFLTSRHKPGLDYASDQGRKPPHERFADAYAAGFLMPETSIRRNFMEIAASTGDFQVADLCRLSNRYAVSVPAMALRLEQLGLIEKGTSDLLREKQFRPSLARAQLRLPPAAAEPQELYPERYKYLAVQAFRQEKISEGQLARFLRVDRVRAREIVAECVNRAETGPTGERRIVELPFERSLLSSALRTGSTRRQAVPGVALAPV
jgi:Zn-dependent peptidase ImmA (M78 family)/DNA-binding XRE family transcriptional regulator